MRALLELTRCRCAESDYEDHELDCDHPWREDVLVLARRLGVGVRDGGYWSHVGGHQVHAWTLTGPTRNG